MEEFYVIQDVESKKYYWLFQGAEGIDAELYDAFMFISEDKAIEAMKNEYRATSSVMSGIVVEVKKYYKIN